MAVSKPARRRGTVRKHTAHIMIPATPRQDTALFCLFWGDNAIRVISGELKPGGCQKIVGGAEDHMHVTAQVAGGLISSGRAKLIDAERKIIATVQTQAASAGVA